MSSLPAIRDNGAVAEIPTAQNAADIVLFMGAQDLDGTPPPIVELDGEGGIVHTESEGDYLRRVWEDFTPTQKAQVVYLGLQRAAILKESLNDGIQLVVWRSYDNGWWIPTQDYGDDDEAFRAWVRDVIVPEAASTTEASLLASTVLNLVWLRDNGYNTGKLEDVFADRSMYNRWRRVASTIRRLIQGIEEADGSINIAELDEELGKVVDTVNDPNKDFNDLDAIRTSPRLPEAIFRIGIRDELGRNNVSGALTDAQLKHVKMKTRGAAKFLLEGEQHDQGNLVMTQYRYMHAKNKWHYRVWLNGKWSKWQHCDGIESMGTSEGAPLVDEEMGVEYYSMWVQTEEG